MAPDIQDPTDPFAAPCQLVLAKGTPPLRSAWSPGPGWSRPPQWRMQRFRRRRSPPSEDHSRSPGHKSRFFFSLRLARFPGRTRAGDRGDDLQRMTLRR